MTKKLEENGLWESSRMMLPQHKEQALALSMANNVHPLKPEPPTKKELEWIKDSIILPVALRIVENKRVEVEMSAQTLKLLYSEAAQVLARNIGQDIHKYRKLLVERNIRVAEESKSDGELVYRYDCRGMEEELIMTKDFMLAEISLTIGRYVKHLISALQKT